jgi:CRP/FNR family transcriptional regulator, cyclic AMP receptor protein
LIQTKPRQFLISVNPKRRKQGIFAASALSEGIRAMTKDTLLAVLHRHPFVEEFKEEHIEKLATLAREIEFKRDQVIFHEGDDFEDFYLIVQGRVALEIEAPDHTFRIQTLANGDELGWSAILMGRGKHFQARALQDVKALGFNGPQLLEVCREDKAFGFALMYRMLGVVSERLQATRLQLLDMYSPVAKRAGT